MLFSLLIKLYVYTSSHNFYEGIQFIYHTQIYYLIFQNCLLAVAIFLTILLTNFLFGDLPRSEYLGALRELGSFVFTILYACHHLSINCTNIHFCLMVWCRFFICLLDARIKQFSTDSLSPAHSRHKRLFLFEIIFFFYCYYQFLICLKNFGTKSLFFIMMCQYLLLCKLLFESILSHLIIMNDESNGNSINAFSARQKVSYIGSIIGLVIYGITCISALFTKINKIYFLISIFEPVKVLLTQIDQYKKWKQMCQNLNDHLETPSDEEIRQHDICIICRMNLTKETAKKLPCGHICHLECMIMWFWSRQVCPLCNRDLYGYFKEQKRETERQEQLELQLQRQRELHHQRQREQTLEIQHQRRELLQAIRRQTEMNLRELNRQAEAALQRRRQRQGNQNDPAEDFIEINRLIEEMVRGFPNLELRDEQEEDPRRPDVNDVAMNTFNFNDFNVDDDLVDIQRPPSLHQQFDNVVYLHNQNIRGDQHHATHDNIHFTSLNHNNNAGQNNNEADNNDEQTVFYFDEFNLDD